MQPQLLEPNIEKRGRQWYSRYQCFCGTQFVALKGNVTSGSTRSCGCVKRNMVAEKNSTHSLSQKIPRLYRTWKGMRQRCYNAKTKNYANYGGRGICIDQEWHDYAAFYSWALSNGYTSELTIDRIDVNGNYSPLNCRWATKAVQGRNRRDTLGETIAAEILATKTGEVRQKGAGTKALAEKYGVCISTIKQILRGRTYA